MVCCFKANYYLSLIAIYVRRRNSKILIRHVVWRRARKHQGAVIQRQPGGGIGDYRTQICGVDWTTVKSEGRLKSRETELLTRCERHDLRCWAKREDMAFDDHPEGSNCARETHNIGSCKMDIKGLGKLHGRGRLRSRPRKGQGISLKMNPRRQWSIVCAKSIIYSALIGIGKCIR